MKWRIARAMVLTSLILSQINQDAQAIDLGPPGEEGSTGNPEVLGRKTFGTEDAVAEGTLNEGCLEYCPYTGVCIWLVCYGYSCEIETSEKIGHTSPDFVVASYTQPGETPWIEALEAYKDLNRSAAESVSGLFTEYAGKLVDGGMNWQDHDTNRQEEQELDTRERQRQLWFKEVNVIGNPLIDSHRELIESMDLYACPVDIDEFELVYSSEADGIAWRGYSPQTMLRAESWLPGSREVGTSWLTTWGSVHPRVGYLTGTEGPKVAAVTAQRAIDITTRENQPRVYTYPYDDLYPPNFRDPSDEQTDRWLMIHPAMEHQCYTFGQDPDYAVIDDGARNAEFEGYGYIYWSLVQCCEPVAGFYLFSIDIPPQCFSLSSFE